MSQPNLQPDLCIRYVEDVSASSDFYAGLFGRTPERVQENFAMLRFDTGLRLGLWTRGSVQPSAQAAGGGAELAVLVSDAGAVETLHEDWSARGVTILQAPRHADFGRTFVAADPDGHRIRVYAFQPQQ
jgi:predicted enzyme related to lactoylglutathione lyase